MMSVNPIIPEGLINSHFVTNQPSNLNLLPRTGKSQLHKRKNGNGYQHHHNQQNFGSMQQQQQDVRPSPYIPQHTNSFNSNVDVHYHVPPNESHFQPNLPNFPNNNNALNFGYPAPPINNLQNSLGSMAHFGVPMTLANPQLLNDNMFATFPLSSLPNFQQQPLPISQLSPLGTDIGSFSNLTQLVPQSNFVAESLQNPHVQQTVPFNRQVVLEHLKAQELQQQQQLLKLLPAKKVDNLELTNSPNIEKKHTHHDILRQHNEEYKMKQMKKAAVHQASSRYGTYLAQDSSHFNFILPVLPTFSSEEDFEMMKKEEV